MFCLNQNIRLFRHIRHQSFCHLTMSGFFIFLFLSFSECLEVYRVATYAVCASLFWGKECTKCLAAMTYILKTNSWSKSMISNSWTPSFTTIIMVSSPAMVPNISGMLLLSML